MRNWIMTAGHLTDLTVTAIAAGAVITFAVIGFMVALGGGDRKCVRYLGDMHRTRNYSFGPSQYFC